MIFICSYPGCGAASARVFFVVKPGGHGSLAWVLVEDAVTDGVGALGEERRPHRPRLRPSSLAFSRSFCSKASPKERFLISRRTREIIGDKHIFIHEELRPVFCNAEHPDYFFAAAQPSPFLHCISS